MICCNRYAVEKYSLEMTKLKSLLVASMAIDLGIKPETLLETIQGKIQNIVFHHYPPCRHNADKVIGIPPHTDGLLLTIVLEVDASPGLQVSKDGRWFPVRPLAGSLTVFVGDILEVLTNGRYRSVEHGARRCRERPNHHRHIPRCMRRWDGETAHRAWGSGTIHFC